MSQSAISIKPTPERIRDRLIARIRAGRDLHFSRTPNLRQLAAEFRCTQAEILEILDGHPDVDIIAGVRTAGGHGALPQGEWRFEWLGEDDAPQARAA